MAQVVRSLITKLGTTAGLDKVGAPVAGAVQKITAPTPVKNALSGGWLGHQLHPMVTDLPIGAWTMATALDLTLGDEGAAAARRLVGIGILCAVPAAASGASDWSVSYGATQRVGLVHGAINATATSLQVTSWVLRGRGRRGAGIALSTAGVALTACAGYLGGHLSFTRGVGVNYDAFEQPGAEWSDVARVSELTEGKPLRVTAGDTPVVLVQQGNARYALSATCDHAGGPLDEGTLDGDCIRCPWHGSVFRLADGTVVRGPASVTQPAWHVKVEGDRIHVRPAAR